MTQENTYAYTTKIQYPRRQVVVYCTITQITCASVGWTGILKHANLLTDDDRHGQTSKPIRMSTCHLGELKSEKPSSLSTILCLPAPLRNIREEIVSKHYYFYSLYLCSALPWNCNGRSTVLLASVTREEISRGQYPKHVSLFVRPSCRTVLMKFIIDKLRHTPPRQLQK